MNGSERKETAQGVAPLQKGGVRFAERELAEVDDRSHPVLRIPRERIQQIHLRQGLQAARPAVQLVLGVVFLASGCVLGVSLLREWFQDGGPLHQGLLGHGLGLTSVGGCLCLTIVGGWLTFTALRRGYYLEVRTAKGIEKVRLDRGLAPGEIETFLVEAWDRLGYEISDLQILYPGPARGTGAG